MDELLVLFGLWFIVFGISLTLTLTLIMKTLEDIARNQKLVIKKLDFIAERLINKG
jgi:uncharacterized membrane protein